MRTITPILALIPFTSLIGGALGQNCISSPLIPSTDACWVDFVEDPSVLAGISGDPNEKDMVIADFDGNGFMDVFCATKENFYLPGSRPSILLLNTGGVLVDASAMVTSIDKGSRDVAVLNANGDAFPDLAIAETNGAQVTVLINQTTVAGQFGGFLEVTNPFSCGSANCNFFLLSCALGTGDFNGDGLDDIWATTYGPGDISIATTTGNKVYINDISNPGTFIDTTAVSLGSLSFPTNFNGNPQGGYSSAGVADIDGDGREDLFGGGPFAAYTVLFNNGNLPSGIPTFRLMIGGIAVGPQPYMGTLGDLDGDGDMDVYIAGDNCDSGSINPGGSLARDASNWTTFLLDDPAIHSKAMDNGGNVAFGDLDGDGMEDVLVCDVDTSCPGSATDTATAPTFFRNSSTVVGVFGGLEDADDSEALPINITTDSAWDAAIIDIDNDGFKDVLYATASGFRFFRQLPSGINYGATSPNSVGAGGVMGSSGRPSLSGNGFTLLATGVPAGVSGQFFYGLSSINTPFVDGTLLVGGTLTRLASIVSSAGGSFSETLDFSSSKFAAVSPCDTVYFQLLYRDAGFGAFGMNLTDGLEVALWH